MSKGPPAARSLRWVQPLSRAITRATRQAQLRQKEQQQQEEQGGGLLRRRATEPHDDFARRRARHEVRSTYKPKAAAAATSSTPSELQTRFGLLRKPRSRQTRGEEVVCVQQKNEAHEQGGPRRGEGVGQLQQRREAHTSVMYGSSFALQRTQARYAHTAACASTSSSRGELLTIPSSTEAPAFPSQLARAGKQRSAKYRSSSKGSKNEKRMAKRHQADRTVSLAEPGAGPRPIRVVREPRAGDWIDSRA